ncbi:MAG: 30S ribosomal protein S12 methylthiotransferase RimO [Bacteroidales bacterium]|nr:30S ribosomal protein S12 methylthiotransferase RimO [Bacteroidales bacterium]
MKINIITLGCSKNTVDSENLAGHFTDGGHTVYFDREKNDCDLVVVNTCGFIGDAKEESVNAILQQIAAKKRRHGKTRLVVGGCLVERYRQELEAEMPEVDQWFGAREWDAVSDYIGSKTDAAHGADAAEPRKLSTPSHYAYLKIAEGCDRSCSYCAIPLIRGAHRSRPIDELVAEAKNLVAKGVKELIIISQDTTYYGLDLYRRRALCELLNRLADESGAPWIRLHYTYPSSFPADAIDAIARYDNICNYIDIPLQHINTRILNSMQRGIDRDGTLRLIDSFRSKLPDVAIRTTIIAGYPGETLEEFEELKDFVRTARFDRMGCFAYSPEEGTAAFKLNDNVPEEEKQRRVGELMAIQEQISWKKNQTRIGQTMKVLIDGYTDRYLVGRTQYDSPEVDDEVLIDIKGVDIEPQVGQFVDAVVTDAMENDLVARLA